MASTTRAIEGWLWFREVDPCEAQGPVKNRVGGQGSPLEVCPDQLQVMPQVRAWLEWLEPLDPPVDDFVPVRIPRD